MNAVAGSIGTPGQPWGDAEKAQWRALQKKQRSYRDEVVSKIDALSARFDIQQYGELDYPPDGRFPLYAIRSRDWDDALMHAVLLRCLRHEYVKNTDQGHLSGAPYPLLPAPAHYDLGHIYRRDGKYALLAHAMLILQLIACARGGCSAS